MNTKTAAACLLSLAAGVGVATAPPASAASPLLLGRWVADPSGTDVRTNAGINRETIEVRNVSAKAIGLAGYRVRDKQGFTYVFPKGYVIAAKKTLRVHTGSGTNTRTDVYWRQANYVWNNTGDTAYLQSPKGTNLDVCSYTKRASGTVTC